MSVLPTIAEIEKEKADRRLKIAPAFFSLFAGLAFREAVNPVRASLRDNNSDHTVTVCLFIIFFATCLRFFIGNQLHLSGPSITHAKGKMWLTDFMVVSMQSIVLIFMGGLCSIEANKGARLDFVGLLILLIIIDSIWILLIQFMFGIISQTYDAFNLRRRRHKFLEWFYNIEEFIFSGWERNKADIPFNWILVNILIVFTWVVLHFSHFSIYKWHPATIFFTIINVFAFFWDVYISDCKKLL